MAGIDPQQEFLPGVAVFAVEPDRFVDLRESGSVERLGFPELDDLFERIGAKSVDMAFPFIKDPKPGNTDLRLTYKVSIFPMMNPSNRSALR